MNVIKLDAIESTNDYLKSAVFNNTQVAYTYNQFKGKGQRGNKWMSEPDIILKIEEMELKILC
jgi:BirA family biotin operon repressor/biotin-[acetyl-CoA-carboxylase] ligase